MMKDYIAMSTSQSLMTLHKRCAVLFIGLSLLATVWFQQQCRNFKVIGKFIVTPPILNTFSTFLQHVIQNRKICNFVQVAKALQQEISGYDALFTALMRKSI
jgi:hypothetical protein